MTNDGMIDKMGIGLLKKALKGNLLLPGDELYKAMSQAWNLYVQQGPAMVVMAETAEDIQAAVRFANAHNMGVGVMATGHGVGTPCHGGVLINTSRMRGVRIDPVLQTATVQAGAQWKDVIAAAQEHGLATLAGSAPHVGVIGYTLGGGFGFLGRKYGLNAAGVTGADVVLADGTLLHVGDGEHEDLLWTLQGGGGNFGMVASLEFKLHPLTRVYGGAVFYPMDRAHEALTLYARWAEQIPDEITTAFTFMNYPPLPAVPEILRGKSAVVIKGCYCGKDPEQGAALFQPVRELGRPIADTYGVMPVTNMDAISKDPVDPMGVLQYGGMISRLSPEVIDAVVKTVGAGSGSPLLMVELRKLGGALNKGGINLMGRGGAEFSINALGATATPAMAAAVQTHLAHLAQTMRPYQTGEVFLNFLETDPSPTRIRAAYTAHDWDRLTALKKKYDPKNIFRFNRNISS